MTAYNKTKMTKKFIESSRTCRYIALYQKLIIVQANCKHNYVPLHNLKHPMYSTVRSMQQNLNFTSNQRRIPLTNARSIIYYQDGQYFAEYRQDTARKLMAWHTIIKKPAHCRIIINWKT